MSENFDSEFREVKEDENEEDNEYNGIGEDFVSTGKEFNYSFNTVSNKPVSDDIF